MMVTCKRSILFVVMALLILVPQTLFSETTVHKSGIAVILKGDVEGARNRALAKAFAAALEDTVAGLISFTDVAGFREAMAKFASQDPLDYVQRYRILSDHQDENLYKVEVEISVSEEMVKNRLADVGVARHEENVLKLGVLVRTRLHDHVPEDYLRREVRDFSTFVTQQLHARGFSVIDGTVSVDKSLSNFEKLRLSNRLTAMQGRRLGADAVVLGLVEIAPTGNMSAAGQGEEYGVSLWVRAIGSHDGALLGIREDRVSTEADISPLMLRQVIQQRLDSLLLVLGEDIQNSLR
jgi:hypothetical protein